MMRKRSLVMVVIMSMLATLLYPARPVVADEIRDSLDDSHRYVYELVQAVSDNNCSMLRVIQEDDHYFDKMQNTALYDVFLKTWDALRGSKNYSKTYFNTVIADAITVSEVDVDLDDLTSWDKAINLFTDTLNGPDIPVLTNYMDVLGTVKDVTVEEAETVAFLRKVGASNDIYRNALRLVSEYTKDKEIKKISHNIYEVASSDDIDSTFHYWVERTIDSGSRFTGDLTMESALTYLTGWGGLLWRGLSLTIDLVKGDEVEAAGNELHMTMFQSAVLNAFYDKLYSNGYNYFLNKYTNEDLFDLLCLAELYLKAGYEGFGYNSYKNAELCKEKLHYIEKLIPPGRIVEKTEVNTACPVKISNYSVPAVLSEGDKYACFGKIVSDQALQYVSVELVGSSEFQTINSGQIGRTDYNISEMDNYILINKLPSGSYHYIVKARTEQDEYILLDEVFDIIPEDGNMTINQYHVPCRILEGSVFSVSGIVRSRSILSKVWVEIVNREGDWITGDEASGMSGLEYNLSSLDYNTRFDWLDYGEYRYRIVAMNATGTEVLVDQPFEVY